MASKTFLKKEHPKKSREDMSWILEGIVAFLRSPTWTVPVMNFVEDNCGIFLDTEENRFEYTEIHQNYKKLVESLLEHYKEELKLSETQFSKACSRHNRDIAQMDAKFEYIWAADDFILFKRLMVRSNVQVEMEALRMLQDQYQEKNPEEFDDEDMQMLDRKLKESKRSMSDKDAMYQKREEEDLELAIEFSRLEMERLSALAREEDRLMEQAIRLSLETSTEPSANYRKRDSSKPSGRSEQETFSLTKPVYIGKPTASPPEDFSPSFLEAAAEYREPTEYSAPEKQTERKKKREKVEQKHKTDLPPLKKVEMTSSQAAAAWLDRAMKDITEPPTHAGANSNANSNSKINSIDPEEMAKRKAHHEEQRRKLLEKKRLERDKQLSEYNQQNQRLDSPKAKIDEIKVVDPEEEKKLVSRRAITERLMREVINKK